MRKSLFLLVVLMMEPWMDHLLLVRGFSSSNPVNKKSFRHGGNVRVVPTARLHFSWKNYKGTAFVEEGGAMRSDRQQEMQKEGPSLGLLRRLLISRRKYKDTEIAEGPTRRSEEMQEETSSGSIRRRLNRIISRFRRDVKRLDTLSNSHASLMTTTTNLDVVVQEETTTIQDDSVPSTTVSIQEQTEAATAAPGIDLSGSWKLIVTPEFKHDYNEYLLNCSQPFLFRKIMVNGVAFQHEQVAQLDGGRTLELTTSNPAGNWKRTLVASERRTPPVTVPIVDPDGDCLEAECWWEEKGTKHRSWLRGKQRLQGGCFESLRYVDHNDHFVCESTFHPGSSASDKFKPAFVMWRYQRDP